MTQDNSAYKKDYGSWAGFSSGNPPDFKRCCVEVWGNERGARHHQCSKPRGHGPGEAYCKIHDPAYVAAKQAEGHAKYKAERERRRYEWHGRTFFNALEAIANGHNDPRSLATETIAKFRADA